MEGKSSKKDIEGKKLKPQNCRVIMVKKEYWNSASWTLGCNLFVSLKSIQWLVTSILKNTEIVKQKSSKDTYGFLKAYFGYL